MLFKYFLLGFVIKIIASIDDALTRVPIIASLTKKRTGRIAFSIGSLLALGVVIAVTVAFSAFLTQFPYTQHIAGSLILLLAAAIYFNIFSKKEIKAKKELQRIKKSPMRKLFGLAGTGFFVSFITLLDDSVAFIPLFLTTTVNTLAAIFGIVIAAILQIIVVIHFAKKIKRLKYKREISSIGLLILAVLTFLGLI